MIFIGLSGMLQQTGKNYRFCLYPNFDMFLQNLCTFKPLLVILDPSVIRNNMKVFENTRKNNTSLKWCGILHSICDREVLSMLDGTIQINDSLDFITSTIEALTSRLDEVIPPTEKEPLTTRETVIIKYMLQSLSNKEIACKLHLSIHTVRSHRRKIFFKTGTCKPYGLLTWAISNKIISR